MSDFDKEAVYDAEIAPLMTQIIAICQREQIPIVARFHIATGDDDDPLFCTTAITNWPHAAETMRALNRAVQPRRAEMLAITEATDGNVKRISIRRVT